MKHASGASKAAKKRAAKKASAKTQPPKRRRASWEVAFERNLILEGFSPEEAREAVTDIAANR